MPKLNTLGKLKDEPYMNWYTLIEYDEIDTGGYYIFTVKYNAPEPELIDVPDSWLGYDDWCETWEQVESSFVGVEIEWLEGEEIFFGHRYKNNSRS